MNSRLEASPSGARHWVKYACTAGVVAVAVARGFTGCEAFGMHPGGDVVIAPYDAGGMPCVGTCLPDPGWQAVTPDDCAAANSLDRLPILTFDGQDSTTKKPGALDMYTYSDGTAKGLFVYSNGGGLQMSAAGWQPGTQRADFCGPVGQLAPGETNNGIAGNFVLHLMGGFVTPSDVVGGLNAGTVAAQGSDAGDSCGVSYAIAASPYRGYGGGIGIAMHQLNNADGHGDSNKGLCTQNEPQPFPGVCPPSTAEPAVQIAALDVSTYDGVSFWARRGPNSQVGIRVNVGDKHTDDDLSYITYRTDPTLPRYCERIRQCSCGNHKPCDFFGAGACELPGCATPPPDSVGLVALGFQLPSSPVPGGPGYYCDPPDLIGSFRLNGQASTVFCAPLGEAVTDPNIASQCNLPYPAYPNDLPDGAYSSAPCGGNQDGGASPLAGLAGDRQFWGKPCTPYAWPNGVGGAYCFDPAHEVPADPTEMCGDHWMSTVDLSTNWRFYKVPFTDLRQQGFAKKFEQIDLHSVSVVRFTWDAGWIDYWIDDVSFYRNPK